MQQPRPNLSVVAPGVNDDVNSSVSNITTMGTNHCPPARNPHALTKSPKSSKSSSAAAEAAASLLRTGLATSGDTAMTGTGAVTPSPPPPPTGIGRGGAKGTAPRGGGVSNPGPGPGEEGGGARPSGAGEGLSAHAEPPLLMPPGGGMLADGEGITPAMPDWPGALPGVALLLGLRLMVMLCPSLRDRLLRGRASGWPALAVGSSEGSDRAAEASARIRSASA
eukprot:1195444-Prorocentrum_minimum.AAC.2